MNKSFEFTLPMLDIDYLDESGFRKVLLALVETNSSDVFIKTGRPIAFKKNNKKQYVTKRVIREDELEYLMTKIMSSDIYHKIKNGTPMDSSYSIRLKEDGGSKQLPFRVHSGSFNRNKGVSLSIRTVNAKPLTLLAAVKPTSEAANSSFAHLPGSGIPPAGKRCGVF